MTDLELLFLVLAVIYVWECACWIPRGSIAFLSWTGRKWRWLPGSASVGNQRGGFTFAAPVPPLGSILIASPLGVSISPDAVLAYVSTNIDPTGRSRHSAKLARFDKIQKVEATGRKLLIDGIPFLTAPSARQATWLAEKLAEIRKATPKSREAKISDLFSGTLDSAKIETTWAEFKKEIQPVRYLANGVFCYLLIFSPFIIYKFSLHDTWLKLVIGLIVLTLSTAIFFHRVHKKFYPKAEDERFTHFLITMLSPATTARTHDVLSRPLFECFSPLAVAKVFCTKEDFRDLAQRVLLDIHHPALPVVPGDDPAAEDTEQKSRNSWRSAVEDFLDESGLDPKLLTAAPELGDRSMNAYCPRCHAQFTKESKLCEDCGGLVLIEFQAIHEDARIWKK